MQTQITVQEVQPMAPGKKKGAIITNTGQKLWMWPEQHATVRVGSVITAEVRESNGYWNIDKVITEDNSAAAPAQPLHVQQPGVQPAPVPQWEQPPAQPAPTPTASQFPPQPSQPTPTADAAPWDGAGCSEAKRIFVCAVVGRAMGSGAFPITELSMMVAAACAAYDEHLA